MKQAIRWIVVLTAISAVAAGLLGAVYSLTIGPITQARLGTSLGAAQTVLPAFDRLADPAALRQLLGEADAPEMYAAFRGEQFVGVAIKVVDGGGFGGEVAFMVGLDPEGKVHALRVLEHKETPGLGTKLSEQKFSSQFSGLQIPAGGLLVTKDGGTIEAITGATISSRTATRSATKAAQLLRKYAPRLSGAAAAARPAQGGSRG